MQENQADTIEEIIEDKKPEQAKQSLKHLPLLKKNDTEKPPITNSTNEEEKFANLSVEDKIAWLKSKIQKTEASLNDLKQTAAIQRAMDNLYSWRQQLNILSSTDKIVDADDMDMDVFELITYNAKQVATKRSNSLIVTGQPGVGKTMTVIQAISFLNPHKITEEEVTINSLTEEENEAEEPIEPIEPTEIKVDTPTPPVGSKFAPLKNAPKTGKLQQQNIIIKKPTAESRNNTDCGYYIAQGTCTTAALYELLFVHRRRLLVFDDFDSVLRDDDCVNLLKAALDTYPIREVSKWSRGNTFDSFGMSDAAMQERYDTDGKLPNQFKFTGRIIFVSNIHEDKFDKALISRSLHVEVRLSKAQLMKRLYELMPDLRPGVPIEFKVEALDYLDHLTSNFECKFQLDVRSLIHAIDFRAEYPTEEKELMNGKKVKIWQQLLKKRLVKTRVHY
jgi:hypothetical protein